MKKNISSLKISVIQFEIFWESPQENLKYLNEQVKNLDTDLLVLPEMFSTGFTMSPEKMPSHQEALAWMKGTAIKYDCAVCASLVTSENEAYFNRLYFVYPDGEFEVYDKRHLFTMGEEPNHYAPGSSRLILEYKGWRICPLICYDLRFPVFSRNDVDYDLLIYVANWPEKRSQHWKALLRARAIENQTYVAACNRIGADGYTIDYSGDSAILDFKGDYLQKADSQSCIIEAELSYSELSEGRAKFPVLDDRDSFSADWS